MRVHNLKIWPHFLDEIELGRKNFDIRSTKDRIFQAGDQVVLSAFDPVSNQTIQHRHPVCMDVTAVYTDLPGLMPGHVAMQLRKPG
jgi:hypothetical protein